MSYTKVAVTEQLAWTTLVVNIFPLKVPPQFPPMFAA